MTHLTVALVLAVAALPAAARDDPGFDPRDSGPGRIDVSGYPPEQQASYRLFLDKCSKCHTAARPFNSHFTAKEWKVYLKRMLRRPDTNADENQARELYFFLKYYSEQQKD